MKTISILWVDDEIDLLKPHVLFLQNKNYLVSTANNGSDAIEMVRKQYFDIILLDENMPGLSGLQTLTSIKDLRPDIPVVMITKSEEESIMDKAIGSKISDYLIKPVNPNQILLSIKKNTEHKRLITEKTTSDYQSEFRQIGFLIDDSMTHTDWINVYRKLVYWELELASSDNQAMDEILKMQKMEANKAFTKFVKKNYTSWFDPKVEEKPLLSPSVFKNKIFPHMKKGKKTIFLLIDNLRYDQWRTILPYLLEFYTIDSEDLYFSILPTATQFARNSLFAGLMPSDIEKMYPDFWSPEEDEGGKNLFEDQLLQKQLTRLGYTEKFYFEKILNFRSGKKLLENVSQATAFPLGVIVVNFVDMMSHARTEVEMIRELANNEAAYRSITLSWFEHSSMFEFLKMLASQDVNLVITTDHGAIKVTNPIKVIGDRNTNTNLRYKIGKNLNYNPKEVFVVPDPSKVHLPKSNVSSTYIFAGEDDFFAYPNNYNHYVNYYKDTFQHGGISMEEMIIPIATLTPKK